MQSVLIPGGRQFGALGHETGFAKQGYVSLASALARDHHEVGELDLVSHQFWRVSRFETLYCL
jgi:hypothetical protein